ncbi:hypothetical protein [Haladaptatus sp. NG-WS-4]
MDELSLIDHPMMVDSSVPIEIVVGLDEFGVKRLPVDDVRAVSAERR